MEEKLGTRFGNYELVHRIDVGGMGEVYLAHQMSAFGRPVAIKIIRSDLVHDQIARARFIREAEVSTYLKHEHILSLFEFGEVDGRLFLATPYIEGGTLAARLKQNGPMSLVEVHKLFVPLVQAVAYVHRRGVIHRDLKPSNIMLDMEDEEVYVRLIDFGIATLPGHSASPPLTMAGHEIGTVAYMAPERLSGIAAASNDIFSLGVILHQMLTGRMPTMTLPPPNSVVPKLPEPLAQVVRRAVVANPAERYATAGDLLQAFEQAYQQMTSSVQPGIPVAQPGPPTIRNSNPGPRVPPSRPEMMVTLARSGEVPQRSGQTPGPGPFALEDYNAPTTSLQAPQPYITPPPGRQPLIGPSQQKPQKGTRRKSLFLLLPAALVLVLLLLAGVLYYGYEVVGATSVTVSFAPQTRVISQVVKLKADPNVQQVNLNAATIPEKISTLTKTMQKMGNTTGHVGICILDFNCKPGVNQSDVTNLVNQIEPQLQQSITQQLQSDVNAAHGTAINPISFSDPSVDSNPQVGDPGATVTVTVALQGSVGYFQKTDMNAIVNHTLAASVAQLGNSYLLVNSSVEIGQPKTLAIDPNSGVSSIDVAAGAVARYQFSAKQLQTISTGLVGKSIKSAQAFLESQPGINPTSVRIRFTSGSSQSMPGDTQHIKLTPQYQGGLPGVTLTPIAGIAPVVTPSSTDDGN